VLLARGSLGNPWLFAELVGAREQPPTREEILAEVDWVMERAVEHMGEDRANRYLRKFYPWYIERLAGTRAEQAVLQSALQQAPSTAAARDLFHEAVLERSILSRPSRVVPVDSRASGLFSVPT
jgi:tRNA-dihydrouridine synthase